MAFLTSEVTALLANIAHVIENGACQWFFDFTANKWACLIGVDVFLFSREEEDSITVQYQNLFLLYLRDTDDWASVSEKLRECEQVNLDDLPHGDPLFERSQANIRMSVLAAVMGRIAGCLEVSPSRDGTPNSP